MSTARRDTSGSAGPNHGTTPVEQAPAFTRLEYLTAVVVVGVLAFALGVVAFAMPTHTADKRGLDYTQSGRFGYAATAHKGSIYGARGPVAGQPILLDQVGPVRMSFAYHLKTASNEAVTGTAGLTAVVKLSQGLTRTFPVSSAKAFTGGTVEVAGVLPVAAIQHYVQKAAASFGDASFTSGTGSTLTLRAAIAVHGTLGGRALKASFNPELPFTLGGQTLVVTQGTDPAAVPTGTDAGATNPLQPSRPGTLDYRAVTPNTVPLVVVHPSVVLARTVGFGIAALCLLLGLWLARPLLRSGEGSERTRIQTLYGSRIVEARELAVPPGPVAELASMDALADVAKRYESTIVHLTTPEGGDYVVWDNGFLYRYRVVEPTRLHGPELPAQRTAGEAKSARRTRKAGAGHSPTQQASRAQA
ncbi:MAG: hypothetical protein ACTHNS_10015 [Marmoricola sp.]